MRFSFLIAFTLFLFAGCGSDEAESNTTADSGEAVADAAPTACEDADLIIVEEQLGDGAEARVENIVVINYEGRFESGEVFDSGESVSYPLNQFVPGFRDGVAGMKVGGRRQLTIPPNLAYGVGGIPGAIPPCATLVFDVELLDVAQ